MKGAITAFIYKIVSIHTNKIYIGHTIQDIKKRYCGHKRKNSKCSSRHIIDLGDSEIILICEYQCNTKEEARREEQRHINANKDICVNRLMAYATIEDTRERKKQYSIKHADEMKEWRRKNADILKEKRRKYIMRKQQQTDIE